MNFDDIGTAAGLVAIITLAFICFILARRTQYARFVVVGQEVFLWCGFVLSIFAVTRTISLIGLLPSDIIRNINSIAFLLAVGGIVWRISKHVKIRADK